MKKNNVIFRIYLARALSSFGDWLTFFAVSIFLSEQYGSDKVPILFLIGSIPPLLFSRFVSSISNRVNIYRLHFFLLLLSALNVSFLIFQFGMMHLFIYTFVASLIGTFSRPVYDSILGKWAQQSNNATLMPRMAALSSCMLSISPPIGAFLSLKFGFKFLYIMDAVTFVAAALIFKLNFGLHDPGIKKKETRSWQIHFKLGEIFLSKKTLFATFSWYLLIIIGGFLNGFEFRIFELNHFSRSEISFVLAAWGVGSFLGLIAPKSYMYFFSVRWGLFCYFCAFLTFLFIRSYPLVFFLFLLMAFLSVILGGRTRWEIQKTLPPEQETTQVWSLLNSRLSIINIFCYGICYIILELL